MVDFAKGSTGQVLATLKSWGVTENILDKLVVRDGEIFHGSNLFAAFKCFKEIDEPLFEFFEGDYIHQKFQTIHRGKFKPLFRLTLCGRENPCFHIEGDLANAHLYCFINDVALRRYSEKLPYGVDPERAFLSSDGHPDYLGKDTVKTIMVCFTEACSANAFVEYLNEHYIPKPRRSWGESP